MILKVATKTYVKDWNLLNFKFIVHKAFRKHSFFEEELKKYMENYIIPCKGKYGGIFVSLGKFSDLFIANYYAKFANLQYKVIELEIVQCELHGSSINTCCGWFSIWFIGIDRSAYFPLINHFRNIYFPNSFQWILWMIQQKSF